MFNYSLIFIFYNGLHNKQERLLTMETNEHRAAGNQIRIEKLKIDGDSNPYLTGSEHVYPGKEQNPDDLTEKEKENPDILKVQMMNSIDGIPVPLDLTLSAGDIVALAGDYYTQPGWGLDLQIPKTTQSETTGKNSHRGMFREPVSEKESKAFVEAYSDLASPAVTKEAIKKIYAIETTNYLPFANKIPGLKGLNGLIQQFVYSRTVKDYGKKLTQNEAHFSPWSGRAYIVGHQEALRSAQLAWALNRFACDQFLFIKDPALGDEVKQIIEKACSNPELYQLKDTTDRKAVIKELAFRYQAQAVAQDLFAMHFYSDHFAGGHLSRIGLLRKTMPEQFGMLGGILINNMHNEDNTDSVSVTNPHQPIQPEGSCSYFSMIKEFNSACGDSTYFEAANNENSNMLVNGMTNSLGDIARLMQSQDGNLPESCNYGGLSFLPEINPKNNQKQPLLLSGPDGKTYYRSKVQQIKCLSPEEYQATLKNPSENGYEVLTTWKALLLVIKLRVLSPFYSPKVEVSQAVDISKKEIEMATEERSLREKFPIVSPSNSNTEVIERLETNELSPSV